VKLDLVTIINWLARISLAASFARVALHWAKDGLAIWIEPGASFWRFYSNVESTFAWLAVSLTKFGRKEQVAEDAIKDVMEHPKGQEVAVTVTAVEAKK
jgi:hypothetical protein